MLHLRTYLATVLCMSLLAGCASTGLYTLPIDSQIKVKQELRANGGRRLFIQDGQVLQRENVKVVTPYCWFSVRHSNEETLKPIVIRPGIFTITKSYRQQDWSWAEELQFAGDTDRSMTTTMELSSDTQYEVTSLACSRWGSIYVGGWVTTAEMRTTLNGLVEFVVAE